MELNIVEEVRKRAKHLELRHIEGSELPYRVIRKRTGEIKGSFQCMGSMLTYMLSLDPEELAQKPVSRRSR